MTDDGGVRVAITRVLHEVEPFMSVDVARMHADALLARFEIVERVDTPNARSEK